MKKHHKELDQLFNQLSIDNNKLNKSLSLVTLSTNTISNTVYSRILQNLSAVLVDTHQCLNYLLANLETLDQETLNITKNYLNSILDQFNKHIDLLDQLNPNPRLFSEDISKLHNNILVLNEMFLDIDRSIEVRIFDDEEKMLHKNIKSQLQYINKLMIDPKSFTPENIQKTTKKVNSISIILKSLIKNVSSRDNSNTSYFIELLNEAITKINQLHVNLSDLNRYNQNNANNTTQPKSPDTLEEIINKSIKKSQISLKKIESKARILNRVIESSNRYISLREKTKNPLEDEKIDILSSNVSQTLNKLTYELVNFDFNDTTLGLHEILDNYIQHINRENINQVKNSLLQINEAVDTMINENNLYFENNNEFNQIIDPSINETIRKNMKSAYSALYNKLETLNDKISQVDKIFKIESKITVAIAETQNNLNDMWRKRSTLSHGEKQRIIDQNINHLTEVLSELIQNKSAFMSSAEGREHMVLLLSKIDTTVDELIREIPDKKLKQDYQKAYDLLAENRLQTKQSLPNWASLKPLISGPSRQNSPRSSDGEKTP